MIPVAPMGSVANAGEDAQGIRIKRIQKTIKKNKEKLYRGVNQGYQGANCPLLKFYFGHFSGYIRAYLSIIELGRRRRGLALVFAEEVRIVLE